MQIAALKVFCDVARHRSFSLAASANNITQSAVSQTVSHLEDHLQVKLVDRSTRPLQLTAQGQNYYDGVKHLLERYFELESLIRNERGMVAGPVAVAAISSVGLTDIDTYTARFQSESPDAKVHFEYLHPDKVYQRVLDGSVDLGLVSFPRKLPNLRVVPWKEEEMVVACSPRHPLAAKSSVQVRELDGQQYVHFHKDLMIRRKVDAFLREHQVTVDVKVEFDSIEIIKDVVEGGNGVALLPEPTLRREVKSRTLAALPLADCRFRRPLAIIHRNRPAPSSAARRLIELLLQPDPQAAGPHGRLNGTTRRSPKEVRS